jgi:hypothetical protein
VLRGSPVLVIRKWMFCLSLRDALFRGGRPLTWYAYLHLSVVTD